MMACSMCSSKGFNGGKKCKLCQELYFDKVYRGQRYVGLVILLSKNYFTKLLMGPHNWASMRENLSSGGL